MNKEIENRLSKIEDRNAKVELDKAWETSWTRKLGIAVLTYFVVVAYLRLVVHADPWINALVPVIGYLISTLTMSVLKRYWQSKR